jgi:hypothetical protein
MAIKFNIAVYECDECHHRWLPTQPGVPATQCPSRKCRSRNWNAGQPAKIHSPNPSPRPQAPTPAIAQAAATPYIEPAAPIERCSYKEWNGDLGEYLGCRLPPHSFKVKHKLLGVVD